MKSNESNNWRLLLLGSIIIGIIVGGFWAISKMYEAKPCGYVNYKNEIEPGFLLTTRTGSSCFPCTQLEDPANSDNSWHEEHIRVCPKESLRRYNENARRLNAAMEKKGYPTRFKIYEEKP